MTHTHSGPGGGRLRALAGAGRAATRRQGGQKSNAVSAAEGMTKEKAGRQQTRREAEAGSKQVWILRSCRGRKEVESISWELTIQW